MKKVRILIVDDQAEILDSLGAVLTDEGHEVIRARDGYEALHVVQSDSPDVVFLDIWIPGIDGMQTLRAIKRIDPLCSVVMMSGHGTIETAVKAIKMGAADYLEKPLNLEDVLHLVNKAVSERAAVAGPHEVNGPGPGQIVGTSSKAASLRLAMEKAATEKGSVWLAGDKGTGKEFVARVIHHLGGKHRNSLIKVRCQDLTSENIEEVLLGGGDSARGSQKGKLAQASSGTLLLIRVDRLQTVLRPRLAKIVKNFLDQNAKIQFHTPFRFRIISTSISDPETLICDTDFPVELSDILAQRIMRIPTLRERAEDIPLFVNHFLKEAAEEFDRDLAGTDQATMERLLTYPWPGNVKELKILIEHVVMTAPGPFITANDLLMPRDRDNPSGITEEFSPFNILVEDSHQDTSIVTGPRFAPAEGEHSAYTIYSTNAPVRQQKTLRGRVVMYGQGLHSGVKTGLTLSPLPPAGGILFGHITSGGTVPAVLENVESTDFSTCLKRNGSLARTIEHLMAVFHVYGLTNVLVKISGEVPIMDGSALEFCRLVESAEIIPQDDVIEEIRITEPIELPENSRGAKKIRVEPSDLLEVEYFLDYPPPVGSMHLIYRCNGPEDFKEQIAPARTFGFVKDMRMMDEMGLAGGGRLSNVVLLDDEKVVNPPLRFPDEFVRHKILDIIGDFYLLGRPFRGKIIAHQTGHTENIAMLKLINEKMKIL